MPDPTCSSPRAPRPIIRWWTWLVAVILAVGAILIGWAVIVAWPLPTPSAGAQPLFTVLPPPSLTPPQTVVIPADETATPIAPTPLPGFIGVGGTVSVVGTGRDGLRLRDTPSLGGRILLVALDNEVFVVRDGPRESDGYTWWYLEGLIDQSRKGWGVQNYLAPAGP
jgi:hypothetical protein